MSRDFDGSTQYMVVAGQPQMATGVIALWVYADALPASGHVMCIAVHYEQGESEEIATFSPLIYLLPTGQVKVKIYDGASKIAASSSTISTSTWTHLAMSFNGTNLRVWFNGVNEATTAAGNSYTGFSDPAFAVSRAVNNTGTDGGSGRDRFNGRIAECSCWNSMLDIVDGSGTANVTSTNLTSLAGGLRASNVSPGNLNFYLPMIGDTSPEPDSSGNSRTGALTGSPPQGASHPTMNDGSSAVGRLTRSTILRGGILAGRLT